MDRCWALLDASGTSWASIRRHHCQHACIQVPSPSPPPASVLLTLLSANTPTAFQVLDALQLCSPVPALLACGLHFPFGRCSKRGPWVDDLPQAGMCTQLVCPLHTSPPPSGHLPLLNCLSLALPCCVASRNHVSAAHTARRVPFPGIQGVLSLRSCALRTPVTRSGQVARHVVLIFFVSTVLWVSWKECPVSSLHSLDSLYLEKSLELDGAWRGQRCSRAVVSFSSFLVQSLGVCGATPSITVRTCGHSIVQGHGTFPGCLWLGQPDSDP